MNKKPILFRLIFALIVVAVFALSMYPLSPRNFIDVLKKRLIKPQVTEQEISNYYDSNQDKFKENGTLKPLDKVSDEIKKIIAERNEQKIQEVIKMAEDRTKKDGSIYPSIAIEDAAKQLNVDLINYVKLKNANSNSDVISDIRKQASGSIRLGIDLNGGAEFILKLEEKQKTEEGDKELKKGDFDQYRDAAIEILRNRLETDKIYETEISPLGGSYVSLKVPIVSKDEKLKLLKIIKMSARLQFSLVSRDNAQLVGEYERDPLNFKCPMEYKMMEMIDIQPGEKPKKLIYFVKKKSEMDGKDVENAFPSADQFGQRYISLSFNSKGATRFGQVTAENVGRQLAIILDGTLYSAPSIREAILGGQAQITGSFSAEEAQQISTALISGSLPVKIDVEAVFDTDPTLGVEEVKSGTISGIISLILVAFFMIVYYLKAGVVATIALFVNTILLIGSMAAFEATLTLPGIAGIILTIGMAVDANVLINERIREELANNKTLPVAIDAGYDRAFLTILDSNLTTLMVAMILIWQGTGPIKGFAVALAIGIITSMFSSIFITRLIFDIMARTSNFRKLKMLQFFGETHFNFVKTSRIFMYISVSLIILSISAVIYKNGALGIDFSGGTRITYSYDKRVPEADIAAALTENGFQSPKVTYKANMIESGDNKKLEIVLKKGVEKNISPKEDIAKVLDSKFPGFDLKGGEEVSIGHLIGMQFAKTATFAMILAIIGMIIYISLRFEFSYGIAAIIAIFHDIVITAGLYIICGGEFSLNVVAALLTILGYSVNDTIVVFDRIRENLKLVKNKSYNDIIDLSINQTLSRTILTGGTTMMVTVVMLLMAGMSLRDFLIVLLVGIIVGTYSSIYVASPIISFWHKKSAADKIS